MAIRACFEIGHEAAIRAKRPSEVFTHDWEVFVRGVDNADISQFVEKVVFQLHDTFPKPKRVVKDPPYTVRESGYAGFTLPIEIHLKNRDEPKKIKFTYELTLQHSGPAIIRVQKEKYVFNNPSEEFRRKLMKGGAVLQPNNTNHYLPHLNVDLERNSRDSFTDEKASQMMGKPKFGNDITKKHKTKEFRMDDMPRASNSFENLFGTPIHKNSTISPDPKKPSPNPKSDKKDKEKSHKDIDKQKLKYEAKEKEHREEKKVKDSEKEKSKEDKKQKSHKDRDGKEVNLKREKPVSPGPQAKRAYIPPVHSPPRGPSPNNKSNSSVSSKEESKIVKVDDSRNKLKNYESIPDKADKKSKKEKKNHDKDRESKKEHKKEKEAKISNHESRDMKPKEVSKETVLRESSKESKPPRVEKVINKFSPENFVKEPVEKYPPPESAKHKDKSERERKHKHKKKDKKRDESSEKMKDTTHKDKKHKHEKHKNKIPEVKNSPALSDKIETVTIVREPEKREIQTPKIFKEKERSQLTISPISLDTSSQSSSKSVGKHSKSSKNPLGSLIEDLPSTSTSNSDVSSSSDSEELSFGTDTSKKSTKIDPPPPPPKPIIPEPKSQKQEVTQKILKGKDKTKQESREEKKQRKRKTSIKADESDIIPKAPKIEEPDTIPKTKSIESFHKAKESSSRVKTEKVQDDGVSSSLTDALMKCESPVNVTDNGVKERNDITPDYIIQLQELQQRIMTIQSSDELDRIVKLIANTGKYEVTKKTFDFDLCSLDRNTVQQLQELINCESRA